MTCGEKIKFFRKSKGLTQSELSQKVGVTYSTISKYEIDEISIPSETLKKIANVLEVSTDYLLGNTNISNAKQHIEELCKKNELTDEEYDIIFNDLINTKTINLNLLNSNNSKIKRIYTELMNIYSDYLLTDSTRNIDSIDSIFIDMLKSIDKNNIINKKISNVFPIPEGVVKVPVVGKIAAGIPILAYQNIIDYAFAPASQIKEGFEYFYLYVERR